MTATLTRRLGALEATAKQEAERRWQAAVIQLRETMDPEHARMVATWLQEQANGKRHGPCVDNPNHVCPRCINRLNPPALARAVWFLLLDHMVTGAPVAMPPHVAEVYLNDPQTYPADRCEGCDYLMPTRSTIRADGSYRHIARYLGACPVCGHDNQDEGVEDAG